MEMFVENLSAIANALGVTLMMVLIAGVGSILLGTLITAARISPIPILRTVAFGYVQFFVNVPLLVLLLLAVFALPDAGLMLPLTPTAIIVLLFYEAAYVAEAVRSGVNTVGMGQIEAGRALGLTLIQSLRLVVIPQALRASVQPIGNVMIALTMNTALAAAVGVVELTARANKINLIQAQPILIFTSVGLIYMALALTIGLTVGRIEKRTAIHR
jgi:glutamate transport system permease protein